MARKFRVGDVVRVKEETRHEVHGHGRRLLQRHLWTGTVRSYIGGRLAYGVQAGKSDVWSWFAARELDLVERPKPKKGGK